MIIRLLFDLMDRRGAITSFHAIIDTFFCLASDANIKREEIISHAARYGVNNGEKFSVGGEPMTSSSRFRGVTTQYVNIKN